MTITAKILEIKPEIKEWTGDYGTNYGITMRLDNAEWITLWKKKKDAFKVGDEVKYEVVEPGRKWKEVKEGGFKKSSTQSQEGYFTSIAFQIGFEKAYKKEEDFNNAVYLSKRIFAEMIDNLKNPEEKKTEEAPKEEEKKDDLPF